MLKVQHPYLAVFETIGTPVFPSRGRGYFQSLQALPRVIDREIIRQSISRYVLGRYDNPMKDLFPAEGILLGTVCVPWSDKDSTPMADVVHLQNLLRTRENPLPFGQNAEIHVGEPLRDLQANRCAHDLGQYLTDITRHSIDHVSGTFHNKGLPNVVTAWQAHPKIDWDTLRCDSVLLPHHCVLLLDKYGLEGRVRHQDHRQWNQDNPYPNAVVLVVRHEK